MTSHSARAIIHCGEENNDDTIRPFEWLTSPQSLKALLESLNLPKLEAALHIGSGSSTVGEYLVEECHFARVWDVDKDGPTLERMQRRWHEKCQQSSSNGVDEYSSRLSHEVVDFAKDPIPVPDASCDLVLDKSTLDCTLCSDDAAACLLAQVYRCLAVGGVYVLISFHEPGLIVPLLQELPGAHWEVTCQTMDRQVERLDRTVPRTTDQTTTRTNKSDQDEEESHCTTAAHMQKPLTVLIARKLEGKDRSHTLDMEMLKRHVHQVNDAWFQESHPLLTHKRAKQLKTDFANPMPLPEAYQYLFIPAEREHLTYEHFLEDWEYFSDHRGENSGLEEDEVVGVVASDRDLTTADVIAKPTMVATTTVSYQAAEAFLTAMQ